MGSNSVLLFQDLLREAKAAADSHRIQVRSKGKQVRTCAECDFCHGHLECAGVFGALMMDPDSLFDGKDEVKRNM